MMPTSTGDVLADLAESMSMWILRARRSWVPMRRRYRGRRILVGDPRFAVIPIIQVDGSDAEAADAKGVIATDVARRAGGDVGIARRDAVPARMTRPLRAIDQRRGCSAISSSAL
jgi:hypothetical protein